MIVIQCPAEDRVRDIYIKGLIFLESNMKITHKLVLVIVLGLILISGLGMVARKGIDDIRDRFDELVQLPIPSILRLSNMTEAFILGVDEARSYRLYGSAESKDAYYENMGRFNALMVELKQVLGYGTADIPPEDTILIDQITEKTDALSHLIESDFDRYEQKDERSVSGVDPFRAQENEIVSLLGQYRDMERDEIGFAHAEVESAATKVSALILILGLIFLMANLLIDGFLVRSIVKPLNILTEAVKGFGQGDMNRRMHLQSSDELGVVAKAFDTMADNIQRSHADLEAKIAARTAELKEQLEEVEKMNTMMIDREMAMIELKKENKELKDSLKTQ